MVHYLLLIYNKWFCLRIGQIWSESEEHRCRNGGGGGGASGDLVYSLISSLCTPDKIRIGRVEVNLSHSRPFGMWEAPTP